MNPARNLETSLTIIFLLIDIDYQNIIPLQQLKYFDYIDNGGNFNLEIQVSTLIFKIDVWIYILIVITFSIHVLLYELF